MNMRKLVSVAITISGFLPALATALEGDKLGNVSFPISCKTEVQPAFNRAVAILHNFWYPQSLNAFIEVAKADPDCAMAYWGMAMAVRTNPLLGSQPAPAMKRGWEEINRAMAAGAKSERERDYIAALGDYYTNPEKGDYPSRVLAYEKAMEQLAGRYPDDIEAQVFYALALNEGITVTPADKTYTRHYKAAGITEKILAKQPDHPGALHYLIHSYDFPGLATRGIPAANHYASVAPAAPHAIHMPSHIYSMLGMWEESIKANQAALTIAKTYVHTVDFMVYAHLQLGQDREALRLMETSAAIQKDAGAAQRNPTGAVFPSYTAYAAIPARVAIERSAWADAAALELRSTTPAADAITHFTRAMGFAKLRDIANAAKEINALQTLREELLALKSTYWAEQVDIQIKAATAWVAHAEGKGGEALKLLRSAADVEDASEKHVAMENRLYPMRELLGELLLEMGQAAPALREYQAALKATPNRYRGLYGAARAAEAAGDRKNAADYYAKLVALAKNADTVRPELARAKAYLAALGL